MIKGELKMKIENRKSISDNLQKYCILAKDDSFIEVTEWANGEGWDITINDRHFHLTHGELDAINHLINCLQYGESY